MIELLAPAGSMEALRAAVQNGADAVYLGCGSFNARQSAKNFTIQTLSEAVKYCHVRGVQVHLTLNTLVSDREMHKLAEITSQITDAVAKIADNTGDVTNTLETTTVEMDRNKAILNRLTDALSHFTED